MTLGLVFVSLTILAFAHVVLDHSETSEERIKEFGETERLYNMDQSISRSLSRMSIEGMNKTHRITTEGNIIRLNTHFTGEMNPEETDIINQFEITRDRVENESGINFTGRNPFMGENDFPLSIQNYLEFENSTRYHLHHDKSMYIDFTTWPENLIYFNNFNETNTESINVTIISDETQLYLPEPSVNAHPPTCTDCINLTINNFYSNLPKDQVSMGVKQLDVTRTQVYFKNIFEMHTTHPTWSGDNVTLVGSWTNSSQSENNFDYYVETKDGLVLTMPNLEPTSSGGCIPGGSNIFDLLYFGTYSQSHCLAEDIQVIIEVKLRGEDGKRTVKLVGPPAYDVSPPLLDTYGLDLGMKYFT